MILPFSTQIKGEPTFFPEKILSGLLKDLEANGIEYLHEVRSFIYDFGERQGYNSADIVLHCIDQAKPKRHTIRQDKNDRWKPGTIVDFFINSRQPNMFRFAPRIPVISTQKINIEWFTEYMVYVTIDNKPIGDAIWDRGFIGMSCEPILRELAKNDGFESVEDFFAYFNKDFKGKIIHWTDLQY